MEHNHVISTAAMAAFCAACTISCKTESEPTPAGGGNTILTGDKSGPANGSNSVVVSPIDLEPGTTNVDRAAPLRLLVASALLPTQTQVASMAAAVSIIDTNGRKVGARIALETDDKASSGPSLVPSTIAITPEVPFKEDSWYWLSIVSSEQLSVTGTGAGETWVTHFFTGSAPRIRSVRSTPKNPMIAYVGFSEPVDIGKLDASALIKTSTGVVSKCTLIGTSCAGADQTAISTIAFISITRPLTPEAISMVLSGSLLGSGRTVAEGALAAGDSLDSGSLVRHIAASAWQPCSDEPNGSCWKDARPLPTAQTQ